MSAKTELSRITISKPNAISEAKSQLATKASLLLGYHELRHEVGDIKVRKIFAELGIEPLSLEKVERYKDKRTQKNDSRWVKTELKDYTEEIPLFALSRAVELKERIPEAHFYVDHMVYAPRDPDPFLCMSVGGVVYYLDVWDEPEFEGRRVV